MDRNSFFERKSKSISRWSGSGSSDLLLCFGPIIHPLLGRIAGGHGFRGRSENLEIFERGKPIGIIRKETRYQKKNDFIIENIKYNII